ncbi:MAG: hypothetical protein JNK82_23760 [Myxococcaceae bacterium]|nr:hypothetical protein [Myxococcaceae bacterium]
MYWVNAVVTMMLLGAPAEDPRGEVQLSTTAGADVRLSELLRGRPSLIVFEDRESIAVNQHLKDALAGLRKSELLARISVVSIANVAAYDYFPARNLATRAIKDTEKATGVPVHLDWKGAMTRPPWAFASQGSTVVVVDRGGALKFSRCGKLEPREVDDVLALLASLSEKK